MDEPKLSADEIRGRKAFEPGPLPLFAKKDPWAKDPFDRPMPGALPGFTKFLLIFFLATGFCIAIGSLLAGPSKGQDFTPAGEFRTHAVYFLIAERCVGAGEMTSADLESAKRLAQHSADQIDREAADTTWALAVRIVEATEMEPTLCPVILDGIEQGLKRLPVQVDRPNPF